MQIPRILVAVDLSDRSQSTVEYARALATTFRTTLHILHVVPDAARESWATEAVGVDLDDLTSAWCRDASLNLGRMGQACSAGPLDVTTMVRRGDVAEEILAYAVEQQIKLIVMGFGAHSAVARALRGSTVDRVVRKAPCPVMTVPAAYHEAHLPGSGTTVGLEAAS